MTALEQCASFDGLNIFLELLDCERQISVFIVYVSLFRLAAHAG